MICRYERTIFKSSDGFCIFLYVTEDQTVPMEARRNSYQSSKKILIDEKVNDEGGHGYRVVERLVELGFSKKELMVLKFTESDIDRALQEGEEYV